MKKFMIRVLFGLPASLLSLQGAAYYFFDRPFGTSVGLVQFVACVLVVTAAAALDSLGQGRLR
jgi:hypothetical protein